MKYPGEYDANSAYNELTGQLGFIRAAQAEGRPVSRTQLQFLQHFGAIDQAAREGGKLPDAWHARPGMQSDHPHMTTAVCAGDRVVSEENRTILKGKAENLRSAIEAWKQLKAEGDNPRGIREELERVADEASNLAKHLQILGVVDGLFDGWEI